MTDAHRVADAHDGGGAPPGGSDGNPPGGSDRTPPGGSAAPPPAAPSPAPAPASAPLRRSREHKVIGGVCGGLGRYCDMDPVIFRVVLSVLAVAGGVGLIVYGFCWLLVPLLGEDENEGRRLLSGRVEGTALTAVLCALVGCGLFLSMLNKGGVIAFSVMLSLATVGAAYWSLHRHEPEHAAGEADAAAAQAAAGGGTVPQTATATKHAGKPAAKGYGAAPPETQAPPTLGGPSWWRDPIVKDGTTGHVGTGYLWGPDDGPDEAYETSGAPPAGCFRPVGGYGGGQVGERGGARGGEPPSISGWTLLTALAAAAVGTAVSWSEQPLGTSLEIGLACALAVFAAGIAVSSRYGRTGAGMLVAAVLTSVLLAGAAALPKSVTTDWRRETWRPPNAAAVHDTYELGTGVGTLKLTGVTPGKDRTVRTRAEVGAGRLAVTVPDDVRVRMRIEVGLGDVQLPGDTSDDVDIEPAEERTVTLEPTGGRDPRGTLELELEVGVGQVQVIRG
ncbi:PspC domain-containing protein [Streptomyces sp. XD-27]|uniref:PspC domain-containing protein n=1 Tax=Streptomyces sp. XD-27 TaxID=3062779 RepID=UPI0026F41E37|nr:PspC domain-containing protein [Streptomyces sp. XD-27]WKX70910.1 PspC domain-containing protein [Streptomyces sp. XD-27]